MATGSFRKTRDTISSIVGIEAIIWRSRLQQEKWHTTKNDDQRVVSLRARNKSRWVLNKSSHPLENTNSQSPSSFASWSHSVFDTATRTLLTPRHTRSMLPIIEDLGREDRVSSLSQKQQQATPLFTTVQTQWRLFSWLDLPMDLA